MINLLPEEEKRDIRAARTNVILLRYNFIMIIAIAIIAVACLLFYLILFNSQQRAQATTNDNIQKSASLNSVRTAATSYRTDLTLAKAILNNGVSYTNVMISITKLLPKGTVLDNLSLSSSNFGAQTKFQANAVSYAAAQQLKKNFQTSTLFSNVYFETLSISDSSTGIYAKYPVTISMDTTMAKTGAFNEN